MTTTPPEMNDRQFAQLEHMLTEKTGIRFRNRAHLSMKLSKRLRALSLDSYSRYLDVIQNNPEEILHAIETVTTNETFFFRDSLHLVALEKYLDRLADSQPVFRVWSAASSSGEEAYSIAMTVHAWAASRKIPTDRIKIMGSDIDRTMLKHAVEGIYHRYQVKRTPAEYRSFLQRYLACDNGDYYSIRPEIKKMVSFRRFNLLQPLPFSHPLDVIFCRNVFLYFSQNLRNEIFIKFHQSLKTGGLLVMGLCEPVPVELNLGFKFVGHAMYIKQ